MPFVLAGYLLVLSLVSFVIYGVDKHRAKRRAYRIPEAALLSLGFFGGALGALAAMQMLRHKTKHWYFYAVNVLGLAWQAALLIYLLLP